MMFLLFNPILKTDSKGFWASSALFVFLTLLSKDTNGFVLIEKILRDLWGIEIGYLLGFRAVCLNIFQASFWWVYHTRDLSKYTQKLEKLVSSELLSASSEMIGLVSIMFWRICVPLPKL